MHCPKCSSLDSVLNGIVRGKQRFRCQECACNYTQSRPRGYGLNKKLQPLQHYKEGLGFRSIGRLLGVSNVTVLNWIRGIGQEVQHFVASQTFALKAEEITIVEMDELWHFVGQKNGSSGYGLLWRVTPEPSSLIVLAAEAARPPNASGQL
jgi:transposase-like protein